MSGIPKSGRVLTSAAPGQIDSPDPGSSHPSLQVAQNAGALHTRQSTDTGTRPRFPLYSKLPNDLKAQVIKHVSKADIPSMSKVDVFHNHHITTTAEFLDEVASFGDHIHFLEQIHWDESEESRCRYTAKIMNPGQIETAVDQLVTAIHSVHTRASAATAGKLAGILIGNGSLTRTQINKLVDEIDASQHRNPMMLGAILNIKQRDNPKLYQPFLNKMMGPNRERPIRPYRASSLDPTQCPTPPSVIEAIDRNDFISAFRSPSSDIPENWLKDTFKSLHQEDLKAGIALAIGNLKADNLSASYNAAKLTSVLLKNMPKPLEASGEELQIMKSELVAGLKAAEFSASVKQLENCINRLRESPEESENSFHIFTLDFKPENHSSDDLLSFVRNIESTKFVRQIDISSAEVEATCRRTLSEMSPGQIQAAVDKFAMAMDGLHPRFGEDAGKIAGILIGSGRLTSEQIEKLVNSIDASTLRNPTMLTAVMNIGGGPQELYQPLLDKMMGPSGDRPIGPRFGYYLQDI